MSQFMCRYWHDKLNRRIRYKSHGAVVCDWTAVHFHNDNATTDEVAKALLNHFLATHIKGYGITGWTDSEIKGKKVVRCLSAVFVPGYLN